MLNKIPLRSFSKQLRATSLHGLANSLHNTFNNQEFSDLIFAVKNTKQETSAEEVDEDNVDSPVLFHVHKAIVAARSPVFRAMLVTSGMEESQAQGKLQIEVNDSTPEAFHDFLTYIYTGSFDHITQARVLEVYMLAGEYNIVLLQEFCQKLVKKSLCIDNVLEIFLFAQQTDKVDLVKDCGSFLNANFREFSQKHSLEEFPYGLLLEIVQHDTQMGDLTEYEMSRFVEKWLATNQHNITTEEKEKLIKSVRYALMTVEELQELQEKSIFPYKLIEETFKYMYHIQQAASGTNLTQIQSTLFPDAYAHKRFNPRMPVGVDTTKYQCSEYIFNHKSDLDGNGIVGYWRQKHPEQFTIPIANNDYVKVTASSVWSPQPHALLGYGVSTACDFWTSSGGNQWIQFDLNASMMITHYTLKHSLQFASWYIRSWNFQCSNDGVTWKDLDVRVGDTSINGQGQSHTFAVNQKLPGFYKMFRVYLTGPDSSGAYFIGLSAVEFYGIARLVESKKRPK